MSRAHLNGAGTGWELCLSFVCPALGGLLNCILLAPLSRCGPRPGRETPNKAAAGFSSPPFSILPRKPSHPKIVPDRNLLNANVFVN